MSIIVERRTMTEQREKQTKEDEAPSEDRSDEKEPTKRSPTKSDVLQIGESRGASASDLGFSETSEPTSRFDQEVPVSEDAPLEDQIIEVLKTIHDPEIPLNIYELGLVYKIEPDPSSGHVGIQMTLTSPGCPVAGMIVKEVETKVSNLPNVTSTEVDLVWDPPWTTDMMSNAAKLELNLF